MIWPMKLPAVGSQKVHAHTMAVHAQVVGERSQIAAASAALGRTRLVGTLLLLGEAARTSRADPINVCSVFAFLRKRG